MSKKLKEYCKRGHLLSQTRVRIGKNNATGCSKCIEIRSEEYKNKMYAQDPEWQRKRDRLKSYNITSEQYNSLREKQDSCCAICNLYIEDSRDLYVDHDHRTKKIRGLLCHKCNVALGLFLDNKEILSNAIKYLEGR